MSNRAWYMAGLATAGPIVLTAGLITRLIYRRQYATPLGERRYGTNT